jgi:acyl-CoA synthetase (AMP-forming)/AMP-acid ligase II
MNLATQFFELLPAGDKRLAIREADGSTISRGELRRQIVGLQQQLLEHGFKQGDSAVIQAPNGVAFAAATIAVSALGGVSILAEPGLGDEIYTKRLEAAHPRWVLVHPIVLWANRIPGARRFLARREIMVPPVLSGPNVKRLKVSAKLLARGAADGEPVIAATGDRDDVTIIFTGGTTSLPKGVRLSHGSVGHTLANIEALAADTDSSAMLADTPQQVLYGLVLGKEVVVTRGRMQRRAAMVLDFINRGVADAYFGSPFLWMEMMELAGPNRAPLPASLKAVFLGGAPVTPEFLKTLRAWLAPTTKVTTIYGLTEAGPVATASDAEKIAWDGDGDLLGRLAPGMTTRIADNGEIMVASPGLFTGYIGQPELGEDEAFATGDLGRIVERDGEETLILMGRAKDMIIRAAVNIYPATLEADLRAIADHHGHRLLREAALIGLWDEEKQDEAVVLCWQPMAETEVDEGVLEHAVHEVTGEDAKPDFMMRVDPMPVTGRQNKVDKAALRTQAAAKFGLSAVPRGQRQ